MVYLNVALHVSIADAVSFQKGSHHDKSMVETKDGLAQLTAVYAYARQKRWVMSSSV